MHAIRPERPLRLASKADAAAPSPESLVAGLMEGDPAAATATWRAYAPMTYRMLRRLLGPDQEVDDLAQEVFLRVFSSIGSLRNAPSLASFIQGIAIRVAQKDLRKRWLRRWLHLSRSGELPDVATAHDDAAREALRRFYALLDSLDLGSRTLFVLRHIEDRELVDVAHLAGISLATVKRKLARVEAKLSLLVAKDSVLAMYSGGAAVWLAKEEV